jgi:hypothetical protein
VAACFVVVVGIAYVIFPTNTDPVRPPANMIWHFRLASAGGQVAYWAVLGTAFGILCARAARREGYYAEPRPVGHGASAR